MIDQSIQANAATRRNGRPPVELIYCAGGNKRFAEIAISNGFKYGARLPDTVYFPIYFADQDWKKPVRSVYMNSLKKHKPHMATVLDLERKNQLGEVLSWAEEAAQFVDVILIIPKFSGVIGHLPHSIGGADVRLAYSVPTRYAGTEVPLWEFNGWPIHLLGGSPHKQIEIAKYLNVVSTDGNMIQKVALKWGIFWHPGKAHYAKQRHWPKLNELDSGHISHDVPYVAFELSCKAIKKAWDHVN